MEIVAVALSFEFDFEFGRRMLGTVVVDLEDLYIQPSETVGADLENLNI